MTFARRFLRARRVLAVVMLPSVLVALGAPVPASDNGAPDCHHSAHSTASVSPATPGVPGCDHDAGAACAVMAGCLVLPTALASGSQSFNTHTFLGFLSPFVNGALHGRLGLGPPTPPPNS